MVEVKRARGTLASLDKPECVPASLWGPPCSEGQVIETSLRLYGTSDAQGNSWREGGGEEEKGRRGGGRDGGEGLQ